MLTCNDGFEVMANAPYVIIIHCATIETTSYVLPKLSTGIRADHRVCRIFRFVLGETMHLDVINLGSGARGTCAATLR
jgi:hypothetical protein